MSPGAAQDPLDPTSTINTVISVSFYSSSGTHDLIGTTGGIRFGSRSTIYMGSADDAALMRSTPAFKADRRARNYTRRFYQKTEELQRWLVTLHNTLDPIVPFPYELNYIDLITKAGAIQFLTALQVESYGYC